MMDDELVLEHCVSNIILTGECIDCTLRKDINDGMNITSHCMLDHKTVDKLTSKCHLSEEDQEHVNFRNLIKTVYIK